MQRVPNFGSLLQGYSLKKMLESLGHEVSFIDIEERPEDHVHIQEALKDFSFEYGRKKGKKTIFQKIDRYFINRLKNKKQNQKQNYVMKLFQDRIIDLKEEKNREQYDCCVIGSDEVFNALNASEWGFTSQLFGNVSQADKVITYAASCGFTSYEELPYKGREIIRDSFAKVSAFSVRDENTRAFVASLSDKKPILHYDPVVVGDFSKEAKKARPIKDLPERYCIIYAYHNRINRPEEIRAIKKLCKKNNMEIITVGASQTWVGKHMVLSPFQIPEVFSKAEFVVTDTFHGTIFSAKYARRFGVLVRDSNENKLADLLAKLEIEEHRVDTTTNLPAIYEKEHDLDAMHRLEERERKRSLSYLKQALAGEMPDPGETGETVCKRNQCTGCMACVNVCHKDAITIADSLDAYNAKIDPAKCVDCQACLKVCPNLVKPEFRDPILWKQGWIPEETARQQSSSGGAAAAFAKSFVEAGGYVCSCQFKEGEFLYHLTNQMEDLKRFAGSKYVKSNPGTAYKQVKELLKEGNKVLWIGLPCQVAGILSYVGEKWKDNLYTVDLICHGTPSPQLLDSFLKERGYSLKDSQEIGFRRNLHYQVEVNGRSVTPHRVRDLYTHAFLGNLDYTENCYSCQYAKLKRVSDLSLGDSWKSNLAEEEKKGISLILCQTEKGRWLMEESGLHLEEVSLDHAIHHNERLRQPAQTPAGRKKFFQCMKKGSSFGKAYQACYPKTYYKNQLKEAMIRLHLLSAHK